MKKIIILGIICLFVGMSFTSISGNQINNQIIKPLCRGDILYVGGSGPGNYTSIQSAIDDASNGDTVYVYDDSSPYYENIIVNKSIDLIGEDRDTTTIYGDGNDNCVIELSVNQVIIEEFTIKRSGEDYFNSGINITSDWNIIKNNNIIENRGVGIRLYYSNYNIIENNTFKDNAYQHIHLANECNNNTINNNTLTASENRPIICDGIWLSNSYNNLILNNEITRLNLNVGISLYKKSSYNVIKKNIIHNNPTDEDANIIQITQFSNFNLIIENQIKSNKGDGIQMSSGAQGNIIYHNNFINNTLNACGGRDNIWDNGYPAGGNYWDDYNGIDSDGDGIGDTPYPIPGSLNEDRYPLMEPYGNHPPSKVIIHGPTHGKVGVEYNYTFNVTDGDGDSFKFYVYWGDGTEDLTDLYPNGTIVTLSHSWDYMDTYLIKAEAIDEHGAEGPTGELAVTIPRDKSIINLFLTFLQSHPGLFPLLQKIIQQLGFRM
jgi:parallel beta-helix repeat protein